MKTLLSMLVGSALLLPAMASGGPPAPLQGPAQAPGKSVQAPAQAPVQAPNKTAMAPASGGYRTYSYQPAPAAMNGYGYGYGYGGYGQPYRAPTTGSGFYSADHKIRGPW